MTGPLFDIAVAVLGRDASFDPQSDPSVRLEARRLRRDLEHAFHDGVHDFFLNCK